MALMLLPGSIHDDSDSHELRESDDEELLNGSSRVRTHDERATIESDYSPSVEQHLKCRCVGNSGPDVNVQILLSSLPRDMEADTDHPVSASSHILPTGGMVTGACVSTQPSVEPNFPPTEARDSIQGLGGRQAARQMTDLNPSQSSLPSSGCSTGPFLEHQPPKSNGQHCRMKHQTYAMPINDQGIGLELHAQPMPMGLREDVVVQHVIEILDGTIGFTVESWNQGQVHPGLVKYFETLREKMENSYITQVGNVSSELRKEYLGKHDLLQQLRQQLDITRGESKVEPLSEVTRIAERMTGLEERTQKLHADLNGELTNVSRDIPNVVGNLLSSALQ